MEHSPPGSSVHGILQARMLEYGCHSLLQRVFPDQGLNPGLLHCKHILYHISRGKSLMLWLKAAVICSPSYICSSPVHQLILVVLRLATLLDAEGQPALALHSKFVLGLFHMNIFYGPRKGEVCPWPKQSHKCPTTQIELKFFLSRLLILHWLKETCCQAQYKAEENYNSMRLRRRSVIALIVKNQPANAGGVFCFLFSIYFY